MAKKGTADKNRGPKAGGRDIVAKPLPPKAPPISINSQIYAAKLAAALKK